MRRGYGRGPHAQFITDLPVVHTTVRPFAQRPSHIGLYELGRMAPYQNIKISFSFHIKFGDGRYGGGQSNLGQWGNNMWVEDWASRAACKGETPDAQGPVCRLPGAYRMPC